MLQVRIRYSAHGHRHRSTQTVHSRLYTPQYLGTGLSPGLQATFHTDGQGACEAVFGMYGTTAVPQMVSCKLHEYSPLANRASHAYYAHVLLVGSAASVCVLWWYSR